MILTIIKLINSFATLKKLAELFIAAYNKYEKEKFLSDNVDAINKAKNENDQRPIEHQMGSRLEGKPSGEANTTIDDSLPPNIS